MTALKILICDDDKQEHIRLDAILQTYREERKIELVCRSFYSAIDLLADMKNSDCDLILLDVVMPGLNGIQAAKEIRLFNKVIKIVFLSTSREFAVDSYSVEAYSYLIKPVSRTDLFVLLDKIRAEIDSRSVDSLVIKSREGIIRIPFASIEYVDVMNKRVSFHLTDNSVRETSAALLDFEPQLLSRGDFSKVHRSFLINLNCVQSLNAKGVVTQTGHTIPISKMLYAQIKEVYMNYLFISQTKTAKTVAPPAPRMAELPNHDLQKGTYRILLVDDEPDQQNYWARILQENGCAVDLAGSAEIAMQLAAVSVYDCVVLDVVLHGECSYSCCKRLRELTGAPVIFLSYLSDSESQLQGFLAGGIDYITKDSPSELFWAKIEARLVFSHAGKAKLSFEPLVLDLSARRATIDEEELVLTPTEFDLLWIMAEHAGTVYTPEELFRAVWGMGQRGDGGQSVQVHLSRMRRKLEKACPSHCFIETEWGRGYRFVPKEERETDRTDLSGEEERSI